MAEAVDPANRSLILNVDDADAARYAKSRLLRHAGYEVIDAATGAEALRLVEERSPDLVLLDVKLPDIDGLEVCRRIKQREAGVLVLQTSATFTASGDRVRSLDGGADSYLAQPAEPEELLAAVRALLRLRSAESALRESENRLRLAQTAADIGVWDWNIATNRVSWSDRQWRLFGIPPVPDDQLQDAWRRALHPDDLARVEAALAAAIADPAATFDTEYRILVDGAVRWLIGRGEVVRGPLGVAVRMVGVNIDITARKDIEAELERLVQVRTREREDVLVKLHESQKLEVLGQITGGVAHDFNNLLMTVLSSLELLRKRLPADTSSYRLLDNAVQGAERGAALTQRMLAFARRQDLKPEAVDVAALIHGMADLLRRSLDPGVRIEMDFPPGIRAAQVDANQLELALLNLAVNARDAMPAGGRLTVRCRNATVAAGYGPPDLAAGDYVRVAVSDTGVGMDAETRRRATEPFFTTKGPGKGTGLGLSMIHGLAGQSGGAVQIESQPGVGTTVEMWLPVSTHEVAAQPAPASQTAGTTTAVRACRVLLVDDDPLVAMTTAAMLEDLGHGVIEAHSAIQALALLRAGEIVDLVITDHAMPDMTGAELAGEIHAAWPRLPVILATGYADLPSGMDPRTPRLNKPYLSADLAAAVAPFVANGLVTAAAGGVPDR
jgi:signal transduction histidine kinase